MTTQARRRSGPGFVYLFRCENGLTKIGKSADPARRIKNLSGYPVSVHPVHAIATDDMSWLEALLHRRFRDNRVRGEWFALGEEDVAVIMQVARWDRSSVPPPWGMPKPVPKPANTTRSAKLRAEVYSVVRAVASQRGIGITEYLTEIVNPIASKDLRLILQEAASHAVKVTP